VGNGIQSNGLMAVIGAISAILAGALGSPAVIRAGDKEE